ncbi:von Willebrand factor D and EGF domain-containing protein-like [Glandiceps talaboti]
MYSYLDEPWRSRHIKYASPEEANCDKPLTNGWYRLVSDIPQRCVPRSYCSTDMPVWMRGQLPDTPHAIVQRSVCATTSDYECCGMSWEIEVKYCVDFNVYNLIQVPVCNMTYCTENSGKPCFEEGTNCTDPCQSHKIINDPWRSMLRKMDENKDVYCDDKLIDQWYRFDGDKSLDIPSVCVQQTYCNTDNPLWMTEPPPTEDGEVSIRTICATTSDTQCCGEKWDILVKNCQEFNVYYLKGVPTCNMSYCHDETFGLILPELDPILEGPMPGVDVGTFQFKCKIKSQYYYSQSLYFDIEWLIDGEPHDDIKSEWNSSIPFAILEGHQLSYERGTLDVMIRCRARIYVAGYGHGHFYVSNEYYAGLKVEPTKILVSESMQAEEVRVWTTLPIVCGDNTHVSQCKLPIEISVHDTATNSLSHSQIALSQCILMMYPSDWNNDKQVAEITFSVLARRDFIDDEEYTANQIISFETKDNSIGKQYLGIWNGYKVDNVTVYPEDYPHKQCRSTGDPHYQTFDERSYFDNFKTGYFILVRGETDKYTLEIQTFLDQCGRGASCDYAVAIRENNDLVIINGHNVAAPTIEVPSGELSPGTVIHEDRSRYYVYTNSGVTLGVYISNTLDIYVTIPSDYFAKTEALCGNANNDHTDDLTLRNGQAAVDVREFLESWRVQDGENLFTDFKNSSIGEDDVFYSQSCVCPDSTVDDDNLICCDFTTHLEQNRIGTDKTHIYAPNSPHVIENPCFAPTPIPSTEMSVVHDFQNIHSTDRSIYDDYREDYSYDFEYDPNFEPSIPEWPTPSGITEDDAFKFCAGVMMNESFTASCLDLVDLDPSPYIAECMTDIQVTDDKSFVAAAVESLAFSCVDMATRNTSLYEEDENGDLVPPSDVVSVICPSQCSFKGDCVDNQCHCYHGYIGSDCSVNANQPPQASCLRHQGLCDARVKPCETVFVIGSNFLGSSNLTCQIQTTENDSCLIDGYCVQSNAINPDNPQLMCDDNRDEYNWTLIPLDTTSIPTPITSGITTTVTVTPEDSGLRHMAKRAQGHNLELSVTSYTNNYCDNVVAAYGNEAEDERYTY